MTGDEGRTLNRRSYDAVATRWDDARSSFFGREQAYVDELLRGLPPSASVLDLGCGTGRPIAEYILSKGYGLTGVDQSIAPLTRAALRLPRGRWVHSAIEEFLADDRLVRCFDAVVCWDALFHIDRAVHASLIDRITRLLHRGGRLMVTFGGSAHPAFTDTMFGETFFYDSHPPEKMLAILEEAGFEPLISEFMNVPEPGGDKGRYAVVARLR